MSARMAALLVLAALLAHGGCAARNVDPVLEQERIRAVLDRQVEAWNRGDIPAFMRAYWNSPDLTFSAGGRVERGYEAALERYLARYPTPERMGRLRFDELEIRLLGRDAALVLGRWQLVRDPQPVGGAFSLVLERIEDRWQIIHDHTSIDSAFR